MLMPFFDMLNLSSILDIHPLTMEKTFDSLYHIELAPESTLYFSAQHAHIIISNLLYPDWFCLLEKFI